MAQPLAKPDDSQTMSSLDAAASRLEKAFARLEGLCAKTGKEYPLLKAEREKLNHLLREAEQENVRLREVTGKVSERLDRTIATLEGIH